MEFEKHLKELEKISEDMSSGKLSLKDSIEAFKKGLKIITNCKKELTQAEQTVKKLISIDEKTEEAETEEFELESE